MDETITNNIRYNFERKINKEMKKEVNEQIRANHIPNNIAYRVLQEALFNIESNLKIIDKNTYLIELDMYLPENIMQNLENIDKENYFFSIIRNLKEGNTKIIIYERNNKCLEK